jgi:hypothetical protein
MEVEFKMLKNLKTLFLIVTLSVVSITSSVFSEEAINIDYLGWFSIDANIAMHGQYGFDTAFIGQLNTQLTTKLVRHSNLKNKMETQTEENELNFFFYFQIDKVLNNQFKATIKLKYAKEGDPNTSQLRSYKEHKIAGMIGINNQYQFDYEESSINLFFKLNKPSQNLVSH